MDDELNEKRGAAVLLGCPGSGKTTVANELTVDPHIVAISVGRLVKEWADADSETSRRLKHYVYRGELVPKELVEDVMLRELQGTGQLHVIFDGFPRSRQQVDCLLNLCRREDLNLRAVVLLDLDRDEAIQRITNRRFCKDCGAAFNLLFDPPARHDLCDRCGCALIWRDGDRSDAVERRFHDYETETKAVEEFFCAEYPGIIQRRSGAEGFEETAAELARWLRSEVSIATADRIAGEQA